MLSIYAVPKEWQAHMLANPSKMILSTMDYEEYYQMVMFELFEPDWYDDQHLAPEYGTEEFKELLLEKYGVEHQMHLDWVKDSIVDTLQDRYGVSNAFQINQKEKFKEKHGVDNPMHLDWVKDSIVDTLQEKYGVSNAFQINQKQIFQEKHGVDNPMHLDSVKNKQKKNNLEKYGVENVSQLESVRNKKKKLNQDRLNRPLVLKMEKLFSKYQIKSPRGWKQSKDENLVKIYENLLLQINKMIKVHNEQH